MARVACLRAERLVVRFGATVVLRECSLSVKSGEVCVLRGANGSGKSTLLRVLAGLTRPVRGVVAPLDALDQWVTARTGWLGHDAMAYDELDVRENVELWARLAGREADDAWREVVGDFALSRLAHRRFGVLSRGQRQRALLARLVAQRPDVALLDEPWTGLDAQHEDLVPRAVSALRASGACTVVVSHRPDAAERLGGRAWLLEAGRLSPVS